MSKNDKYAIEDLINSFEQLDFNLLFHIVKTIIAFYIGNKCVNA